MELTTEVKGIIARCVADFLSHPKIALFAMSIGVDPQETLTIQDKILKAVLILDRVPAENAEIVIKTIFEMSKKGTYNHDFSGEIRDKINFVLERTMNCIMNENGELIPIFDPVLGINEKQTYLERKLHELGFNKSFSHYQGAMRSYRLSPKGSLSLLRASYETLVEEILTKREITLPSSFKDQLKELKRLGVLIELDNDDCDRCHHRKMDSEYNFAYDFYSILSHYGSHTDIVTEPVANWLYTSTSAFIWFILKRYEELLSPT